MNRTATSEELKALIAAHAAEIAALKVENEKLAQRVVHLEEQLRLERLHRYAPRSEKLTERIFNEAEQAAAEGEETDDVEAARIVDTGLEDAEKPEPKKRGRKPLPRDLPRERVEHDLPEDQKACPCCRNRMHRMGETVSEQLHKEPQPGTGSVCEEHAIDPRVVKAEMGRMFSPSPASTTVGPNASLLFMKAPSPWQ